MTGARGGEPELRDPYHLVGQHLGGRYTVLALIGEGGMGAVYRGEHRALGKRCALKVIRPDVANTACLAGKERFLREARIGACRIAGIPEVYDVDEHPTPGGSLSFLAMELLDGQSLGQRVAQERLPWRAAFEIVAEATVPLEAAYAAQRIVHRDLKPDNLFLCRDGRVMVLDFGIAHLAGETGQGITRTGTLVGTPHFFSREQALCAATLDTRADVYSLGATLYHAVSGQRVFPTDNVFELLTRLATEAPIDIREHVPALPEHAARVIRRAMAPERDDRYPDMRELRTALEGAFRQGKGASFLTAVPDAETLGPADADAETFWPVGCDAETLLPVAVGADAEAPRVSGERRTEHSPVIPTPAEIPTATPAPSRRRSRRWIGVAAAGALLFAGSFLLLWALGAGRGTVPAPAAATTEEAAPESRKPSALSPSSFAADHLPRSATQDTTEPMVKKPRVQADGSEATERAPNRKRVGAKRPAASRRPTESTGLKDDL